MHYISPKLYAYFLWCEHILKQGQQKFVGLLYVGSNCSCFSNDDNNNNNNTKNYGYNNNNVIEVKSIVDIKATIIEFGKTFAHSI